MSTVKEYEPLVDSTSAVFMDQMDARFVGPGRECDLGKWLQMYAFDIIGELTFSKRFGFLESGEDFEDMMHHTAKAMDYIGIVSAPSPTQTDPSLNPIHCSPSPSY